MKKRGIALALTFALIVGALVPQSLSASAAEKTPTPNMSALDAILYGNRHWVYETLIEDDRTNNPITKLEGSSYLQSMAQDAIDIYNGIDENGGANYTVYRRLVDVMEKVYSVDEYVVGLINEGGDLIAEALDFFIGADDVRTTADELLASTDELRYDNLLKTAFTSSFESSAGESINDIENTLLFARKAISAINYFSKFLAFVDENINTIIGGGSSDEFYSLYIDSYILPYQEATEEYLLSIEELAFSDEEKSSEVLLSVLSAVAALSAYEMNEPLDCYEDFSYHSTIADFLELSDISDLLESAGTSLEIASTALDSYLYIKCIQQQRETILDPIERVAEVVEDEDLKNSLLYFIKLMSEGFDDSALSYDSIVNYLRQSEVVSDWKSDMFENGMKKLIDLSSGEFGSNLICSGINIVGAASWAADLVIGLEDTCKKTYELLYWERLLHSCMDVFTHDTAAYLSDPSEELAAKVLDDMLLIQRLRLYGEKIAYGLVAAQMESVFGELYGHGMLIDDWNMQYQQSIDAVMAASVMPPLGTLTVPENQRMIVLYKDNIGFYATVQDTQTQKLWFVPEISLRFVGGVTARGELRIDNPTGKALALGALNMEPGADVTVYSGELLMNEMYQKNGSQLHVGADAEITVSDTLILQSCSYEAVQDQPIRTKDLIVRGAVSGGRVQASGSVDAQSGALTELILDGGKQTVSGTLSTAHFREDNTSTDFTGTVTVTDSLYQPKGTLINPRNLIFSGKTIEDDRWAFPISLQDAAVRGITFQKDVTDLGGTVYSGKTEIRGILRQSGDSTVSDDAALTVRSSYSTDSTLHGAGDLLLYGDLLAGSGGAAVHPRLSFLGKAPQTVSGRLTADTLRFSNPTSVTLESVVTVNETVSNTAGKILGEQPLRLGTSARLTGGSYSGNLSALSLLCDEPTCITGTLSVDSGGTVSCSSLTVDGDLTAQGSLTLACDQLSVSGTLSAPKPLTVSRGSVTVGALNSSEHLLLENGASLTALGASRCSGTLTGSSQPVRFADLTANNLTASGAVEIIGDLAVSGSTTFDSLTLNGRLPQHITGAPFRVQDLYFHNTTAKGISLAQTIAVSGTFENSGKAVDGVGLPENPSFTADQHISRNLQLTEDLALSGCTLTIDGNLEVSGGKVTLQNAHLIVNGMLNLSGGIEIDESSTVTVKYPALISGTSTVDGSLTCRSDLFLRGAAAGAGQITLSGDLNASASLAIGTLSLAGKLPQQIKGVSIRTGDLVLSNTSRGGITLLSLLQYTGEASGTGCIQSGTQYLQKGA